MEEERKGRQIISSRKVQLVQRPNAAETQQVWGAKRSLLAEVYQALIGEVGTRS